MNQNRGRGRGGRGRGQNISLVQTSDTNEYSSSQNITTQRFEEACAKIKQSVDRHIVNDAEYTSSSEEEEDDLQKNNNIIGKIISTYVGGTGDVGTAQNLGRTEQFLNDSLKSGTFICVICIASVKKIESIWSCEFCFGIFHLPCIQKWAKDSVMYQQEQQLQNNTSKPITWFCPKCRFEYPQIKSPKKYLCFCGKQENPVSDPWNLPHTCGQTCEKPLRPQCGHFCLLLCHPGPCPPCPKTVRSDCYCGKQKQQIKRCSAREWSCGQTCNWQLSCKQHKCTAVCHSGECEPCPRQSKQSCICKSQQTLRPCASPQWQCEKVCRKKLDCGNHSCEVVCHDGPCPQCPRTGERSCPCGKSKYILPCTEDTPTCGDTCDKMLECKFHYCSHRCHTGPCGTCLQMRMKRCRCGHREKSLPCHKEYLCEIKCKNTKDCGRHSCNRKCCDGNCPPCEQPCSRTLGCRNHKCSSYCHQGPCYPCPLTVEISCDCGATKVTVPCGREKSTKPPKCSETCKKPPDCHHPSRLPHRCHFGSCPPCRQICNKVLPRCKHICPAKCHSSVLVKVETQQKRQGPWEPKIAPTFQKVSKKCPSCLVPIPISCIGKHEISDLPCFQAIPYSCSKPCGRPLLCGNHTCSLICHEVEENVDLMTISKNCETCESYCQKPRPSGCIHQCLRPCHKDDCYPCRQMLKINCHCLITTLYVECSKWNSADKEAKSVMMSCKNQCPKNIECGHRCTKECHEGQCSSASNCKKRMTVRCPCKRIKKEIPCVVKQQNNTQVLCDNICEEIKLNQLKLQEEEELKKQEEEEKKNQEELKKLQRKLDGKKRKQRKVKEVVEEQPFFPKWLLFTAVPLIFLIIGLSITYLNSR